MKYGLISQIKNSFNCQNCKRIGLEQIDVNLDMRGVDDIKKRWQKRILERVGECEFTKVLDEHSPAQQFLNRLFELHFRHPRYASIEPPLPGLPRLPLDPRWVELRLEEEIYLSTKGLDPGRQILEQLESPKLDGSLSIRALLANTESYFVIGRPGAGKSTLIRWACQHLIREIEGTSLIPLMVPLRSYAAWKRKRSEGDIYEFVWEEQLRLPKHLTETFVDFMMDVETQSRLKGLCRVMLDGWDEVPPDLRPALEQDLERFRWFVPVLATSRPIGIGKSHLPEKRFEIVPLPFESMRGLMREWFSQIGRVDLEQELCAHLDRYIGLRELARNPYVLTLLCAVVVGIRGVPKRPTNRAELYREAIRLMVEYCRSEFGSQGYSFEPEEIELSERTAFELLDRADASPFEFRKREVNSLAGDDGRLFRTWELSRLISLTKEFESLHSFLHPTLQEYLAGQELARRINAGTADAGKAGTHPLWMRASVFAATSVGVKSPLWPGLAKSVDRRDRFGLVLVRVAVLLAEVGASDGGEELLGMNILPMLWDYFLRAPDAIPYADAMIQLSPDFVIKESHALGPPSADTLPRIMLLYSRIAPDHPGRSSLVQLAAMTQLKDGPIAESSVADLSSFIGFQPTEANNLSSASEVRTVTEVVEALGNASGPRRRALRMRLAMTHTSEAEDTLICEFEIASDNADLSELLEALATLGTLRARNAVFRRLDSLSDNLDLLVKALRMLRRFPIDEGIDRIVELVKSGSTRSVRIEAALVAGGAVSDAALNRLADHGKPKFESDVEVRKAVLQSLARAGAVGLAREIATEEPYARTDISERVVVAGYLAAIARATRKDYDMGRVLEPITNYFLTRLDAADVEPLEVSHSASCAFAEPIREKWKSILDSCENTKRADVPNYAKDLRGAVCRAIRTAEDKGSVFAIVNALKNQNESSEFVAEAVLTLAYLQPETLADFQYMDTETALWKYSLETDTLVFGDQFVRTSDYTEEADVSVDIESIEKFVETPKEQLKSLSTKQVRRFLLEKANRWKPAIEAIGLPVSELTNEKLQRELRLVQYVFLDNVKAFEGMLDAMEHNEAIPVATREIFNERVVSHKTEIPKTTLRSTSTWHFVQNQLELRRVPQALQKRVGFEGVMGSTAARPALPAPSLTKQDVRDQIFDAEIDSEAKKALLEQLEQPGTTAEQVLEVLELTPRRKHRG